MKLTGYGGWSWEADGYVAGLPYGVPSFTVQPNLMPRTGSTPALASASVSERTIDAEFGYSGALSYEAAFGALLARLSADSATPKPLTATRNDGTLVEGDALVILPGGQTADNAVNYVRVTFLLVDPLWRETTERSSTHTVTGIADQGMPLDVGGEARVYPIITLTGVAARTVFTPSIGWRYRKTFTVTNNTTSTLNRYPVRQALGDTAAIVTATKAQENGDDLLLLLNGKNQKRTLISYNAAASYMWFLVDNLKPGEVRTYDVCYGNSAANFQDTLGYPERPPIDLVNSTNLLWVYNITTTFADAGKGLWYIDRGIRQPSITDRSVPAAWRAFALVPNKDVFGVLRYLKYVATGDKWNASLEIKRGIESTFQLVDNRLADSIELYCPAGIVSVNVDYSYQNPALYSGSTYPVTKFRIQGRAGGAGEWEVIHENSTIYAALTNIPLATYSFASPYPTHLALSLLPYDEMFIPEVAGGNYAILRCTGTMQVTLAATVAVSAMSVESPIYDWAGQFYLNASQNPYQTMPIGGYAAGQSRLMIPLFGAVVIDTEARTVQEWNDTLTTKVRDYDDAAWVLDYTLVDAVNTGRLAREWLPVTPRTNNVTNPSFDTDLTGWTSVPGAGVTIAWSRDTIAEPGAPAGSAKGIVSANSNGVNTILARLDSASRLPVTPGRKYTISAGTRISTTNARPILAINYYNSGGGLLITYYEGFWSPVANNWDRRVFEAVAPATAAFMGAGLAVYGVTAGVLPTVWFDGVRLNGNILTWDALDGGPVVKVAWRQRYF